VFEPDWEDRLGKIIDDTKTRATGSLHSSGALDQHDDVDAKEPLSTEEAQGTLDSLLSNRSFSATKTPRATIAKAIVAAGRLSSSHALFAGKFSFGEGNDTAQEWPTRLIISRGGKADKAFPDHCYS
jgi:hypothetical protein